MFNERGMSVHVPKGHGCAQLEDLMAVVSDAE